MRVGSHLLGIVLLSVACADSSGGGDDDTDGSDAPNTRVDAGFDIADDGAVLGDPTLIDDFEDGDGAIHEIRKRIGAWYSFNDETMGGEQTPAANADFVAAEGGYNSSYAARFQGKGFKTWGAGIGVDFNNTGSDMGGTDAKKPWDASGYTGIAFEAKGNVPVRVSLPQSAIVPTDQGGDCTPSTVMGMECEDGYGKQITLTSEWKTYEIPFTELKQGGWGKKVTFDAKTLTGMMFLVGPNLVFDFSIDNPRFY